MSGQWLVLVLGRKGGEGPGQHHALNANVDDARALARMPQSAPSTSGTLARRVKLSALTPNNTRSHWLSASGVSVLTRTAMTTKKMGEAGEEHNSGRGEFAFWFHGPLTFPSRC